MSFFFFPTSRLSLGLFHDDFEKSRNPILAENEYVIILKQIPRDMRHYLVINGFKHTVSKQSRLKATWLSRAALVLFL